MDRHAWDQLDWVWHVVFGLLAALTAVLVVLEQSAVLAALGLLAAVVVAYAVAGGPALQGGAPSRRGAGYVVVAAPALAVMFALTPVTAVMLFALFPHLWRLLPTRWAAAATALMIGAIAALGVLFGPPDQRGTLLVGMAIALVVAVLMGLWISRITGQSVQRAALVAELERTRAELAAASHDLGRADRAGAAGPGDPRHPRPGFHQHPAAGPGHGRRPTDRWRWIEQTARENLAETRALVAALGRPHLDAATLPAALHRLVERVGGELGIARRDAGRGRGAHAAAGARRRADPGQPGGASPTCASTPGRPALELVLAFDPAAHGVRISDDGRGFDPGAAPGRLRAGRDARAGPRGRRRARPAHAARRRHVRRGAAR